MSAAANVRIWRVASLVAFAASAIVAFTGMSRALDALSLQTPRSALIDLNTLLGAARELSAAQGLPGRDVVFLGDSSAFGTTFAAERSPTSVPGWLRVELRRRSGSEFRVHSLAAPGLDPFGYATLADRIAQARPEFALLGVNLSWFSTGWREQVRRPEFAGLLPLRALPWFASLPSGWNPMTFDVALRNQALVACGALGLWERVERARQQLVAARARLEEKLWGAGAGPERALRRAARRREVRATRLANGRFNARGYARPYGPLLAGTSGLAAEHPALVALGASIARIAAGGTQVLAYTVPIHAEHMRALGVLPSAAFDRSIATIRAAIEAAGGEFFALHDSFESAAFRDARGHLQYEGRDAATARLARRLADLIPEAR